jgi:peroxiredoxin
MAWLQQLLPSSPKSGTEQEARETIRKSTAAFSLKVIQSEGNTGQAMDSIALQDAQVSLRPRLSVRTILVIAVLAAFTIFITWRARVLETTLEQPTNVNIPAPDFWASTPDGRTVSLADFRGQKKVVVIFWASWCAPCRFEMDAVNWFYKRNHSPSSDFEILAISVDLDTKEAANFAAAQKLSFPVLLDPSERVAKAYEEKGIPTMFIIDKKGKITYGHLGYDRSISLARELGIEEKSTEGEP